MRFLTLHPFPLRSPLIVKNSTITHSVLLLESSWCSY